MQHYFNNNNNNNSENIHVESHNAQPAPNGQNGKTNWIIIASI